MKHHQIDQKRKVKLDLLFSHLVGPAGEALEEEGDTSRASVLEGVRLHERLRLRHHHDVHQANSRHSQLRRKVTRGVPVGFIGVEGARL